MASYNGSSRDRRRSTKTQKLTGLHVNNPFGPLVLDTVKEFELCIPSEKTLP